MPKKIISPDGKSWCGRCKNHKSIDDFFNGNRWNGLRYTCKSCSNKEHSEYVGKNIEKTKSLGNAWRRKDYAKNQWKYKLSRAKFFSDHPEYEIWKRLNSSSKKRGMEFTLTRKDLFDWLIKTPKRCHYCDLADLKLQEHFWKGCKRFYENLQIDRKNNSLPYTIDNICFACHICNATKSNIFTYEEFCDIGQRYLKPKWQANLKHLMVV